MEYRLYRAALILCLLLLSIVGFGLHANQHNNQNHFIWSDKTHTPYFADLDNNGLANLILASHSPQHFSYWIDSQNNAQKLNIPLHSKLALLDLNNDNLIDIATFAAGKLTVWAFDPLQSLNQPLQAFWQSDQSVNFADNITTLITGDFNADGLDDLIVGNDNKKILLHTSIDSNNQWQLTSIQQLNGTKWRGIQIADFNNDGRDDVFTQASTNNSKHRVLYANDQGRLKPAKNSRLNWQDKPLKITLANTTPTLTNQLVRRNNAQGGINERGIVQTISLNSQQQSFDLTAEQYSQTSRLFGVPATPTNYPNTLGSSYKAANIDYTITLEPITTASYYQIYHAPGNSSGETDNYQMVYQGSETQANFNHSDYGYQYYKYAACNAQGCSGLSPWRRVVIYTAPGIANYLQSSNYTPATGQGFHLSFGAANGSVDGRTGTWANTWSACS